MWKAIILAGLPMVAAAQEYGTTSLTQSYNTATMHSMSMESPSQTFTHVTPVDAGGYLEFVCQAPDQTDCWTIHYAGFGNALAWGNADPSAPVQEVLDSLTPVETRDLMGGPIFPLRDGAELSWLEIWRSDAFDADYVMTLAVSCCVPTPASDLDLSDTLWTLTFSYENTGDVGDAHGGTIVFQYDAGQQVIVTQRTSNWWDTQSDRSLSFATLTDFELR